MYTYGDALFKLALRSNKSATSDLSNIDKEVAAEAINKALNDWIRRQYHGTNIYKEGTEESRQRIDDLQPLLVTRNISFSNKGIFSDSEKLPKDYRYYNRFSFLDNYNDCKLKYNVVSKLVEEANVDELLNTDATKPSKDFEQSFHTILSNRIRFYHNNEFSINEGTLVYYKNPKIFDPNLLDNVFEFKDDVIELIIDEASKIINGDYDNYNQSQRLNQMVENNN